MKILIVEDEPAVLGVLDHLLTQRGHSVITAETGPLGISRTLSRQPDLVLLDLMLPGCNGIEVCRAIRGFSLVPIIVISARSDEGDKVVALAAGADDYLVKPYSVAELQARIQAVTRRAGRQRREVDAARTASTTPVVVGPLPTPRAPGGPQRSVKRLEPPQTQAVADHEHR